MILPPVQRIRLMLSMGEVSLAQLSAFLAVWGGVRPVSSVCRAACARQLSPYDVAAHSPLHQLCVSDITLRVFGELARKGTVLGKSVCLGHGPASEAFNTATAIPPGDGGNE